MHHSHEGQEKMGNLHSKSPGEESDQTPLRLHYSERLPEKRSTFHSFIYETVIGLVQKLRFVFSLLRPRSKQANPILPIQNPAPIITTINDSSDFSIDDHESQCEKIIIVESSQQWPAPENNPATAAGNEIMAEHVHNAVPFVLLEDEITEVVTSSPQGKCEEDRRREEEVVMVKKTAVVVDEGSWIKHYSSRHQILVVGDGDFSFSASLAVAFGCASNIIATSLDSKNFLKKNYGNAKSNIEELRSRGGKVIHGVDATEMANHHSLGHLNFDRIVYNFPYAGLFKDLSRESQLRRHRRLASLFLKNAKQMINEDGEIHISHKTNGFHEEWKLVSIASSHGLRLIEAVDFDLADYPGYNTKYGFGGDGNFNCYPSNTYKFGIKILN
ncbi:hypothetical protein ACP275_13G112600 [Erythranthe tilingii]